MLNNISGFSKTLYLCMYLPCEWAHAHTYIYSLEAVWKYYCLPIMAETCGEWGAKHQQESSKEGISLFMFYTSVLFGFL